MVSAKQIYDYINSIAPFDTQMDFDNAGLLIGDFNCKSQKVLISLDADMAVINEATAIGANIVITHHPIIFHPLKSVLCDTAVYAAVKNGITVISAHTNLDIAPKGVNDSLAEAAGVKADEYLNDECTLIGHFDREYSSSELAEKLKTSLNINGLRFTPVNDHIHTAAVSCGAGGGSIYLAAQYHTDAFITGEIKHHEMIFANEHHISVFDLGHYNSEKIIVDRLADMLNHQFNDTSFVKSKVFSDKTMYL